MTIKDLARETGYSVGTVSRVLNHHPNVSDKARSTILAYVEKSGFQLNAAAKSLKQQHGAGIIAVVNGNSNQLFAQLIEALQHQLANTGYPLAVDYVDENDNAVRHAAKLFRERKPLGMFFLGGSTKFYPRWFDEIQVPCVLLTADASTLGYPNLSSVTTDDVEAADCAIEYLIAKGHRKIGIISGNQLCSGPSRFRFQGCKRALARHSIELSDQALQTSKYSYSEGYDAMKRLLETQELTAVFAMSDVMAIGAIRALRDCHYRVPEDISVIGFDGLTIGDYYIPKLTTICQQVEILAKRGVEILVDGIEHQTAARHEKVPFTLLEKQSVRMLSGEEKQQ